ncbi:TonB-dependent receptor [Halomonas vilamensis]|uniref:TonB-dependent receptor n=1 Tax=Vreelandella vilamensis TaxID=531309 RepID=A0ABU1H667_9GAMM|nr:TonB-dependent receptor [Halomonas vilamensis]MDR5899709.1 TonB-dependent receptor [Halomonas vilamensis]
MKTRITAPRRLAAFSLVALPLAVQAQAETRDTAADEAQRLNPVVVTANRAPLTADETLSSVTVLDEATFRRQDPVELTDLLRGQPGVDVQTNGSFGKASSVYIRGTGSDSAVLLIDGIRLRSATTGGAAWQHLDPRMFERAEIVRGPRGSLYGADAVGGVVQLFTHQAESEGLQPTISAGGGSFDTQRLSATLSGSEGGTRYSFAGSLIDTDGTAIREGGEDKGYDNTSGLARVAHTFDNGAEAGVLALRARGNTEYDGGNIDFVQQVAGVYAEFPVTESWRSRFTLSEARDDSENFTPTSVSAFETETRTARWENTLSIAAHEWIVGAEHSEDQVSGTTDYTEDSRDNNAVFTQALLDFSPLAVQASLRFDDNQAYGDEVTGSLALGYDLDDHHTLRTSYGTAFKAPTFNDLYFPGFGNPDLNAETSETFELGVRGQYEQFFWDLAAYQTDVEDLIAFTSQQGVYAAFNVDTARIRGAELSAGAELNDWTLQAALTYTDPENRDTGNRLQRRASESLRLDIDRELGDVSLGGSWIAQNHRYDDADNEARLAGYGLVNLRAGWQFAPQWSARLTVDNFFDKDYATAKFFNGNNYLNAGRAGFLSVHFGQ